ncbi:MAG: efflux RND transporter periplasmic adaptor subunit [Tepidisphaeraceae bacterium]
MDMYAPKFERCVRALGLLCPLVCAVVGCDKPAPAEAPPPAVTVARPVQREVIEWDEYTGRLEAVETVEVRARVSGFIEKADFQEGALVKFGDLLFVIDSRPFDAELAKEQAEVLRADAQLQYAINEFRRQEGIRASGAGSELELENARQKMREGEAAVAAAKALVQSAQLNVEWTRVTAPIAGRISRKIVTPGNLINGGAGQATLLTVITSVDPIYCYIDADEQSVLKYARLAREGKRVSARQAEIPCFMQLGDETDFPHQGVVDFVDNRLDPATGTIHGRGVYPNATGWLLPGFFARVRIPGSGRYQALLVPDSAITTDQNQKLLMVVGADNIVHPRPVTLGALFGDFRAIESGIGLDDRVVINGLMQARPGAKVSPQEKALPMESYKLTAPGSPATQALPATQRSAP